MVKVVTAFDRPWEGPHNLGISVLYDQGVYRMYYRGAAGPAETRDHWTNTMTPFLDKRPGVPRERRWKAVTTKPTGEAEISLWVNRGYGADRWEIRRYRLRTGGFVSVHAPYAGRESLTRPLLFQGKGLEINYSTSAAGHVRLEIQDAAGNAVDGYTLEECPEIVGDQIERVGSWKAGSDLRSLASRPVRLRFVLKDANLYSIRFR